MRRVKLLFFILCLSVPLFVFAEQKVSVKEVIDGDTIVTEGGETIRYIGIDCPEEGYYQDGKFIAEPQPFFEEALEANREMVEGKTVSLEFDTVKKDEFGRTLAYVYIDGKMVNAEMIKKGYARADISYPNTSYKKEFLQLEADAQSKEVGIWSR
ncbi:MAG: hypothetical protein GF375_05690 [Candidatus Omnitrophica bacterium]|nr:hypothetical protein [Candidatus Omnitrophota bacterium]MBD3269475.1 hypothetical protein [Candidatus Omnitrophota bacterium]